GGGMLKLEPTEAERVLVARPARTISAAIDLAQEMDSLARKGGHSEVEHFGNVKVLQNGLGLTAKDCGLLSDAAAELRGRRLGRSASRFTTAQPISTSNWSPEGNDQP